MPGPARAIATVTHVPRHGVGLLLGDEALLVPFAECAWFHGATIAQLRTVEWPSPDHPYWPPLDVDVWVVSIRDSAAFPLVSRVASPASDRG